MPCASCGTENRAGSRFCDSCGSPLTVACAACGEANRPDARFCAACGSNLRTDAAGSTPTPRAPAARQATPAAAERRFVTVLFIDLVGFTTLAEDRDPEAVRELLNAYFERATEIVQRHGGTAEKFIGDAVMALWGAPTAHEDDAERAVRAALEVVDAVRSVDPDLSARAGVLTGEAAVTVGARNQGMVAGDLVNTAARLQGVAEPGTVLVGEATMRAASDAIAFEPIGDHALKGKLAPVPAWRAMRVVAARRGHGRGEGLEPPFVGRSEDLRRLKDELHAVGREHRVRLVSITGPPGIGKSRLVWELEKYADGLTENIRWHRGRSPSYGEGITFWALGEMVRRRAGLAEDDDEETTRTRIAATVAEYVAAPAEREEVGQALLSLLGVEAPPAAGREALFPAWRLFFERIADRGTTVLVFEDLQWADSGLLDFVDHLLDWSRALPMLVVTLARPELFDRRPDWAVGRRHLTALSLEPLTDGDVTELLAGLVPGLPEAAARTIVGRADGVPLYAVEIVRSLLADGRLERVGAAYRPVDDLSRLTVPESLRSLIASRLDGVEPRDRSLLQDAAVLGQVFSLDALAAVGGVPETELEARLRPLVRRELLDLETDPRSPERGQYKFMQSLIREVAYGTLARRDRRARHLAVARHYEALGDQELAGALASHYLSAHASSDPGPEADAVAAQARLALSAAAERAASLGSHDQAIAYLEQALAITADPRDRAPLLDRAADSATAGARDAERYARAAVEAYEAIGDRAAAAAATARLGKALLDGSEVPRARALLEAALPVAEAVGDDAVLAETLAHLSRAYMRAAEADLAVSTADRALSIAERLNLERVVAEAFVNRGSALHMLGRRRESVALQAAALEMAQRDGLRTFEMRVRNNLAAALADDEPARSTSLLLEGMELARQTGDRAYFYWMAGTVTPGLVAEGRDWDRHAELLREALESATLRYDRIRLRTLLGLFDLARGQHLEELLAEIAELVGDSTETEHLFALHVIRSEAAIVAGDLETGWDEARRVIDMRHQNPEVPLLFAARVAIWSRRLDRARFVAARFADLPGTGAFTEAARRHNAAAVAALEGRTTEAVAGFRAVDSTMRDLKQHFQAATYAVDAAVLLPDDPRVRALAEASRPLLAELRATPYLARLDAALASVSSADGSPGRTAPIAAPQPLEQLVGDGGG